MSATTASGSGSGPDPLEWLLRVVGRAVVATAATTIAGPIGAAIALAAMSGGDDAGASGADDVSA